MGYAKICEEIKRGKYPDPQKRKKKSEMRGKNGQVFGVELGVQRYPLERKKMDKCPIVELGVSTTHLKKREEKDSPCSPKAKIKKKRRDSNMRSNEK